MATLTIAPTATPSSLTGAAYRAITNAGRDGKLYIQTAQNPVARWITDDGLRFISMDDIYSEAYDFDELNEKIAQRLLCGEDAVYAVCGRGLYEPQLEVIKRLASERDDEVIMLASSGYAEAACAKAGVCLSGVAIHSAMNLPDLFNVYIPLCIEEIDTQIRAGDVKLALLEYYPDDTEVIFAYTDDEGNYQTRKISLYELDRQREYFATTVVIMPAMEFERLERYGVDGVEKVLIRLRAPDGCPWDRKQTHESLKTPLIEEAYEVLDAIEREDVDSLIEELGDLLMQIVFHALIETEKAEFNLRDVCSGVVNKLIFRHPHVFADVKGINSEGDVLTQWEELKRKEKHQSSYAESMMSIPKCFPALMRSYKLQKKAADVGFDWDGAKGAIDKLKEETDELIEAIQNADKTAIEDEMGDVFFAAVNVSRLLKVDPELALMGATDKFFNRFKRMEELIVLDGLNMKEMSLEAMDRYWDMVKIEERGGN